jgi:glycosyltransferase involved in cell wall biosynthesis
MKILHIANWYPSKPTPYSALWIRNQINSLSSNVYNKVYHVEIRNGKLKIKRGANDDSSTYFIIYIPKMYWTIIELISFLLILAIVKKKHQDFDIVNFHIAYPNCAYLNLIRKWVKTPMVITEHWSGYHYNFNISNPKKRRRIQKIFHGKIPIITVSNSLMNDIKIFSKATFISYVLPNIVDTKIFKFKKKETPKASVKFFMVSQWKWPKNPLPVIEAWGKVITIYPEATLKIGGYGPQTIEIEKLIDKLDLNKKVTFIGKLSQHQVALEMQDANVFIHSSEYETFSVVCAESLCCGTPVIASRVGGIPEYIHEENGILVEDNSPNAFCEKIMEMLNGIKEMDFEKISRDASKKFSEKKIGRQYLSILNEIISY